MKLIGITGGVGSGKSEIIRFLQKNYKCRVEFADEVAKHLEEPGEACFDDLVKLLGEDVLTEGAIDNKKMADLIFKDETLVSKVNAIVHPRVQTYFEDAIRLEKENGKIDYFFIEAALLIECGYEKIVDELWYVYASKDTRRRRLKESRKYSDEKIDSIFSNQLSDDEFRKHCDFIIDNDKDLKSATEQIKNRLGGK